MQQLTNQPHKQLQILQHTATILQMQAGSIERECHIRQITLESADAEHDGKTISKNAPENAAVIILNIVLELHNTAQYFGVSLNTMPEIFATDLFYDYGCMTPSDWLLFFRMVRTQKLSLTKYDSINRHGINPEYIRQMLSEYIDMKLQNREDLFAARKEQVARDFDTNYNTLPTSVTQAIADSLEKGRKKRQAYDHMRKKLMIRSYNEAYRILKWYYSHFNSDGFFDTNIAEKKAQAQVIEQMAGMDLNNETAKHSILVKTRDFMRIELGRIDTTPIGSLLPKGVSEVAFRDRFQGEYDNYLNTVLAYNNSIPLSLQEYLYITALFGLKVQNASK